MYYRCNSNGNFIGKQAYILIKPLIFFLKKSSVFTYVLMDSGFFPRLVVALEALEAVSFDTVVVGEVVVLLLAVFQLNSKYYHPIWIV